MDPQSDPEYIRTRYNTRKQIIEGKVFMTYKKALPLIGSDCVFHLYRNHKTNSKQDSETGKSE